MVRADSHAHTNDGINLIISRQCALCIYLIVTINDCPEGQHACQALLVRWQSLPALRTEHKAPRGIQILHFALLYS